MNYTIQPYREDYLEGMCKAYNDVTAVEPHIAPLTPQRFKSLIAVKSFFDPTGVFVATENGTVVGWSHACVAAGSEGGHDPNNKVPRLRMLAFPRNRLKVGGSLVAEATKWLKAKSDKTEILAIHAQVGYPFYRGLWMGGEPMCPNSLPHLQVALEVGGYKNTQESIFMAARMDQRPVETAATVPMDYVEGPTEMKHEPMRESWIGFSPVSTRAMIGGQEAGSIHWVLQPHLDRLGAPCMNIWGLGVQESQRRKGIAAALVSRAMAQAYGQGARFCSVSTQLWNAPAHATYARAGFYPHCVVVGRTLKLGAAEGQP